MAASDQDYLGLASPADMGSGYNAHTFIIRSLLGQLWTATLVKVMGVTGGGGALALAGTVDIQPLVNQLDGQGQATPHGTIFAVPYFRAQGGKNAVILDPEVGDIGIAIFADHDISSVVANKDQANPGSRRRFAASDALYMGGFLNAVPTTFVQFTDGNLTLTTPDDKTITLKAGTVVIDADTINMAATDGSSDSAVSITGTVNISGDTMLGSTLEVTGDATFDANVTVDGTLTT